MTNAEKFTEVFGTELHREYATKSWCEQEYKEPHRKNDILVIRAPFLMKKEAMQRTYDQILKQMESGLVMLPEGFIVALCPQDVEVKFMDSSNDIFKEGGKENGT